MEAKHIFIQLNEESKFDAVKIERKLSEAEELVDRQRKGLLAAIKMDYRKTSADFLKDLNDFYRAIDLPLLSNATVLTIHRKWRVNKIVFHVARLILDELNDKRFLYKKEVFEKIIQCISLEANANIEQEKFKIWLIGKIVLKVYTDGNFNKLQEFINTIWNVYSVMRRFLVPDVFKPKLVDATFKPIWFAFSIFKKQKAQPEIYFVFFNDFFIKLQEPVLAEKEFRPFLKEFFNKNKIDIVYGFSYRDYIRLYEFKKLSQPLFDKIPDNTQSDFEYSHKDRTNEHSPGFVILYNLLSNYGISYFFMYNFFNDRLYGTEKEWFKDVLQGRNLVYSNNLPFTLTKKVAHFFNVLPEEYRGFNRLHFQSPGRYYGVTNYNYTLTQGLIYCAIYYEVRNEVYAKEVLRNIRGFENLDFWINTLCKLYHKGLRENNLNEVIDYIEDQVIRNGRKIDFNTKKLVNLLEEVEAWHEELALLRIGQYKRTFNLPKSDIETFKIEYKKKNYRIKQLLTNKELIEEGRTLSHCVGTYTDNCIIRGSFIFSLRLESEEGSLPLITIEVIDKKIRQKRGKKNRLCQKDEDYIIQSWAEENELKFL